MKQIISILFIIGISDIVNSLPAVQSSTPIAPSTSTEKLANGPPPVMTETKVGKEVPTVQTTPTTEDGSIKPSEISKEATTKLTNEENKTEPTTSKSLKSDSQTPTTTSPSALKAESKVSTPPSGQKPQPQETKTSSPGHKEETISFSLGQTGEPTTASSTAHHGQTTTKPMGLNKGNQASKTNKKSMKTSTAYIDEGKVVIFNGICGPEGCEIEGDVYDELVPIGKAKKHGKTIIRRKEF